MEGMPNIDWTFHARMIFTLSFLFMVDSALIYVAVSSLMSYGPSMQLLFGFEVTRRTRKYKKKAVRRHLTNFFHLTNLFIYFFSRT